MTSNVDVLPWKWSQRVDCHVYARFADNGEGGIGSDAGLSTLDRSGQFSGRKCSLLSCDEAQIGILLMISNRTTLTKATRYQPKQLTELCIQKRGWKSFAEVGYGKTT